MNFQSKAKIVGECWLTTRSDPQWAELNKYADLGLPLGYACSANLVEPNEQAISFVEETYDLLVAILEIPTKDYKDFEEMLQQNIDQQEVESG